MSNLRYIYLALVLFTQITFLNAQDFTKLKPEKNVPVIVVTEFNQKFPLKEPVWFSQYQGRHDQRLVFEARFIFDNRYSSAVYDKNGGLIAFAAAIEKKEIPSKISEYMVEHFPSFPIIESFIVTRGNNDVTYEIGIFIDNELVIKVFKQNGDFIKSTKA